MLGGDEIAASPRTPEIVADAAVEILSPAVRANAPAIASSTSTSSVTAGVSDLAGYGGGERPIRDLFLDAPPS